ncbi:MAG: hypothetical protein IT258_14490, partial [Saprospiraceae bacterium]|nr:hypothetical protein [Saprospiraceae bacterium]
FNYDYLDRLTNAVNYDISDAGANTVNNRYNEVLTYNDARGNISTLQRQGFTGTCTFGQIDALTYTYTAGTNKLASIAEAAPAGAPPFFQLKIALAHHEHAC